MTTRAKCTHAAAPAFGAVVLATGALAGCVVRATLNAPGTADHADAWDAPSPPDRGDGGDARTDGAGGVDASDGPALEVRTWQANSSVPSAMSQLVPCPAQAVLVGVDGRIDGEGLVAVAPRCSRLQPDGTLAEPESAAGLGGSGGTPFSDACDAGQVVVSAQWTFTTDRVTSLRLQCAPVRAWVAGASGAAWLALRGVATGTTFGSPCNPGWVLTTIAAVAAAERVTAFGWQCYKLGANHLRELTVPIETSFILGGIEDVRSMGGTHVWSDCAAGELVVGVAGRAGPTGVYAIGSLCAALHPDGTTGPARAVPIDGVAGGADFSDVCPAGQMVAAVHLRVRDADNEPIGIALSCADVATQAAGLQPVFMPRVYAGSADGSPFLVPTGPGMALTGIRARFNPMMVGLSFREAMIGGTY